MKNLPPRLSIELTARCNHDCPFCYGVWHEIPGLASRELDTAAWCAILYECARRGVREVQFTGGEPLLRDDLETLIDHARAMGLKTALYTNASLLTENRLLALKRLKTRISTSLPGLASYGTMTGTDRSPWGILSAIERAAELAWPMAVGIPLAKPNLAETADLVSAALLVRAAAVQVGPAMWEGRMKTHPDWMLSAEEWTTAKTSIRALPSGRVPILFADEFFCSCREQPDNPAARWPAPKDNCPAGRTFGALGPDGRFRRCLHTLDATEWFPLPQS